jgi:hypothetical protein
MTVSCHWHCRFKTFFLMWHPVFTHRLVVQYPSSVIIGFDMSFIIYLEKGSWHKFRYWQFWCGFCLLCHDVATSMSDTSEFWLWSGTHSLESESALLRLEHVQQSTPSKSGCYVHMFNCLICKPGEFKGTVSPDIVLHFSFWKIKFVLSAEPLMVLTFFYFVVPEIFKNVYLNCFYKNTY